MNLNEPGSRRYASDLPWDLPGSSYLLLARPETGVARSFIPSRPARGRMSRPPAKMTEKLPVSRHAHRTAKIVELVGSSHVSFDEAIRNAIEDAAASTRGITGAHVTNMSIKCEDGHVIEYKVDMKVAFGIERTPAP